MAVPSCSLSIMVARTDLPFMMHTIPHLVRSCNFPFVERVLFVDTAPLSGDKVQRPGLGTIEQLRAACQELLDRGIVDRLADMDYGQRPQVYRKHFGWPLPHTHNWKGYPIFGSLYALEAIAGDYLLHFDSDMMLYQKPGHDWISEGVELLKARPDVMSVRPLTGPPADAMHQVKPFTQDPDGFYRFKFFSSRAFLIDRRRFDQLLPWPILWHRSPRPWFDQLPTALRTALYGTTGRGRLDSWELMVSKRLELGPWWRAVLPSTDAWTVHPNLRSPEFLAALPQILAKIEQGWYPPEQAGQYDLQIQPWLAALAAEN
ncbi:hypothetical protein H6G51_16140 [Limnothrix sp. FACHB-708]|uniref:hypothetical protein n=1 Tax=unclassified Limnothrix TaxID=2632864 RepID=UPI0016848FF2|nr:hypothetical protein [Limnothrix sp. FACHB-708]MBD2592022.1 hypothetical protein [Limnothrix sp. FACHB-406]